MKTATRSLCCQSIGFKNLNTTKRKLCSMLEVFSRCTAGRQTGHLPLVTWPPARALSARPPGHLSTNPSLGSHRSSAHCCADAIVSEKCESTHPKSWSRTRLEASSSVMAGQLRRSAQHFGPLLAPNTPSLPGPRPLSWYGRIWASTTSLRACTPPNAKEREGSRKSRNANSALKGQTKNAP